MWWGRGSLPICIMIQNTQSLRRRSIFLLWTNATGKYIITNDIYVNYFNKIVVTLEQKKNNSNSNTTTTAKNIVHQQIKIIDQSFYSQWQDQTMDPPAHLSEKLTTALKLVNKITNKLILDITLNGPNTLELITTRPVSAVSAPTNDLCSTSCGHCHRWSQ